MFNFLANCPHIPNFSNLFGASQNEDEIQSYANFGFPEGVTNSENAESSSANDSTTDSANNDNNNNNNNNDTGAVPPSVLLPKDQNTEQDSICEDSQEDEGPWFYIPSGPFCDTQKNNITLAEPAASKRHGISNPDEDVLCISGLAELKMPADTSPSLRSWHKAMDRGWMRFPEA
jgi:hypothetical protein